MTETTSYRILSRLFIPWASAVTVAAACFACESRVVVGVTEDSGAGGNPGEGVEGGSGGRLTQQSGGFSATGGTSTGGAGTGGDTPSGGGQVAQVYDPCDAVGQVTVREVNHHTDGTESASVYVVAFDPPRLLGTKALEQVYDSAGKWDEWRVTMKREELAGAPSCELLRGSLVFIAGVDGAGALWVEGGQINAGGNSNYCNSVTMDVDASVGRVDQVRAFGMVPGEPQIEGPLNLTEATGSSGHWTWSAGSDPPGFPGCTGGYLIMTVAHRGKYLAASSVSAVPLP